MNIEVDPKAVEAAAKWLSENDCEARQAALAALNEDLTPEEFVEWIDNQPDGFKQKVVAQMLGAYIASMFQQKEASR